MRFLSLLLGARDETSFSVYGKGGGGDTLQVLSTVFLLVCPHQDTRTHTHTHSFLCMLYVSRVRTYVSNTSLISIRFRVQNNLELFLWVFLCALLRLRVSHLYSHNISPLLYNKFTLSPRPANLQVSLAFFSVIEVLNVKAILIVL